MTAPLWAHRIVGRCHCGNICYVLHTDVPADDRVLRVCHCDFCRRHRPRYWSDPSGELAIFTEDPATVRSYRFGQRTAEFVLCGTCGVFCFAITEIDQRHYAVANLNLALPADARPSEKHLEALEEDETQRTARRKAHWTPLTQPWSVRGST